MSGGEKRIDRPSESTKPGERLKEKSVYSSSELGVAIELTPIRTGLTVEGNDVGSKMERSVVRRGGESREVNRKIQHSQQLKFYGRRNRVKQSVSLHVPEVAEVELAGVGLVGLAVDLTEQLQSGFNPTSIKRGNKRDGRTGEVASREETSGMERVEIIREFESEAAVLAKLEDGSGTVTKRGGELAKEKIVHVNSIGAQNPDEVRPEQTDGKEKNTSGGSPALTELKVDEVKHATVESSDLENLCEVQAPLSVEGDDSRSSCLLAAEHSSFNVEIGALESNNSKSGGPCNPVDISENGLSTRSPDDGKGVLDGKIEELTKEAVRERPSADVLHPGRSPQNGNDSRAVETPKESQDCLVPKDMPVEDRMVLQSRQYEESVLARAEDVWARHELLEASKRIPTKSKEPGRCKTHWDFVLEEMTWLAKDFERERKWKLSQAKRVALRVSRSKIDVEAKGLRRQKEEEQKTRRVASNIAKDVKKFWMKVEKLVMYKHQLELEEHRKKALDKHLDFLLGQTERYSTMLAENLGELPPSVPAKALHSVVVQSGSVLGGDVPSVPRENNLEQETVIQDMCYNLATEGGGYHQPGTDPFSGKKDSSAMQLNDGIQSFSKLEIDSGNLDADGDEDYVGSDVDEEDDEATIAAEEALVTEDERREELSVLEREQTMSLSELMKRYRRSEGDSDRTDDSDVEDGHSDQQQMEENERLATVDNELERLSRQELDVTNIPPSDSVIVDSPTQNGKFDGKGSPEVLDSQAHGSPVYDSSADPRLLSASFVLSDQGLKSPTLSEGDGRKRLRNGVLFTTVKSVDALKESSFDDREYIPATAVDGTDEDDETTLEEEELMARAEAKDCDDEVDRLRKESEMPVEELLAQYRLMADAFEDEDSDDLDDNYIEDRQDRTSEAGTSGSSDDDETESTMFVSDSAEAKERMGEPSTSGREYVSTYEKKFKRRLNETSNIDETPEGRQRGDGRSAGNLQESDNEVHVGRASSATQNSTQLNVTGNGKSESRRLREEPSGLLLLEPDYFDAETAEALARVSAAAKRRGERMMERGQKREELAVSLGPSEDALEAFKDTDVALDGVPNIESVEEGKLKITVRDDIDRSAEWVSEEASNEPAVLKVEGGDIGVSGKTVILNSTDNVAEPMACKLVDATEARTSEDKLADAAAAAQSAQPTGYTFSTTKVRTKLPFLLKHSLREYQHIGLDWLVTMYDKRLNGILADEMGLGKTIMTISLLAHLACDRGIWGPHLIVVPTSVMLNWETEFMKWCPAFKILTYFGSAKERKMKRQGWSKLNYFHVCITTYRLVIQDAKAFKRKKWKYLILDEAHLIKNWKSQRWQTLLNFNSKRRILLTGTPLQNDLMELWSLMHFLMPHVFQSHSEFRDWFSNPITGMVEGQEQVNKEVVDRLHNVLRPFLLRRLKKDVEKQLPQKYEHVVPCRLSKRQRNLYEDFMASSDTQATLSSGNFLGLINVLMQLRKVCNHPDLFEGRPIVSSFDMVGLDVQLSSSAVSALQARPFHSVNISDLNFLTNEIEQEMTTWECGEVSELCVSRPLIEELGSTGKDSWHESQENRKAGESRGIIDEIQAEIRAQRATNRKQKLHALFWLNMLRCMRSVLYGLNLRKCVSVENPIYDVHKIKADPNRYLEFSSVLSEIVVLPLTRLHQLMDLLEAFIFAIPAARAPTPVAWCSHGSSSSVLSAHTLDRNLHDYMSSSFEPLRPVFVRRQLFFPDRRLLQFDCGKLQELAVLLRRLKSEGHRALIFTQMTKMLDVLESFINLYGYTYMRLDGSTKPEQRQILMQRFNTNPKIFLFILSTRSGGVGINLVGADTVIFYDSDWNPAMDQQAQDRCHRIGQTREVHIYRLVSERTIEENILRKANQKRMLDDLVIQSGGYNTEFFKKLDPRELFSGLNGIQVGGGNKHLSLVSTVDVDGAAGSKPSEVSSAEVEAALKNAEDEADYMAMKRVEQEEAADNQEFTEEGIGNLEEEELVDDVDEGKAVGLKIQSEGVSKEGVDANVEVNASRESESVPALMSAEVEEEMDMLADVKQMAAAAAASGRGSTSFGDQLHPVERYAMRFLELWDPRIDRASEAAQVRFEEKEWELDQLEKLKEEQEAEIDEDNEPLYYESWDTSFANEAYRQQVEVLAQQQENQRQLEWEAMEEEMRDAERAVAEASFVVVGPENFKLKSKSLKKLKKTKFKSLKKGSLKNDMSFTRGNGDKDDTYSISEYDMSSLPSRSPSLRKRKAPRLLEEDMSTQAKKLKKEKWATGKFSHLKGLSEFEAGEGSDEDSRSVDVDVVPTSRYSIQGITKKKPEGKISIMAAPVRKCPLIMLEKERKKDVTRLQEQIPSADTWFPAEDAVLCAVVHEYGGNWQLASDALAGVADGSLYRGRHRHPVHCRERFRQLLSHNAMLPGDVNNERSGLSNAHMKVTEEHTKRLLDYIVQLADNEFLLQRHYTSVLTTVKKYLLRGQVRSDRFDSGSLKSFPSPVGVEFVSSSGLYCGTLSSVSNVNPIHGKDLVADALVAGFENDHAIGTSHVVESNNSSVDEPSSSTVGYKPSQEELESISEYLVSDISGLCSSDDRVESSSVDDFLPGFASWTSYESSGFSDLVHLPTPATVFQNFSEDLADDRYRTAMTSCWGPCSDEWAAGAYSGLGLGNGPLKSKSKKRPPQSDLGKGAKSKHPRVSKAIKRSAVDIKAQIAVHASVSRNVFTCEGASIPVFPEPSGQKMRLSSKKITGELVRDNQVRKLTGKFKASLYGGGSLSKKAKKLALEGGAGVTRVGLSKVKSVKSKSGDGGREKTSTASLTSVQVVDDVDVAPLSTDSIREVSRLLNAESTAALDEITVSGSVDDVVIITGHPPNSNSQSLATAAKPLSRGKFERPPVSLVAVERLSEKSLKSRSRESGAVGPKTKHKSSESSDSLRSSSVPLEVPVAVSGWVTGTGETSRDVLPVAVIQVTANNIPISPQTSKKVLGKVPVPTTVGCPRSLAEGSPSSAWKFSPSAWPSSSPTSALRMTQELDLKADGGSRRHLHVSQTTSGICHIGANATVDVEIPVRALPQHVSTAPPSLLPIKHSCTSRFMPEVHDGNIADRESENGNKLDAGGDWGPPSANPVVSKVVGAVQTPQSLVISSSRTQSSNSENVICHSLSEVSGKE